MSDTLQLVVESLSDRATIGLSPSVTRRQAKTPFAKLIVVGRRQYHLAVAGGCEAFMKDHGREAFRLRTHPLPRGGTNCDPRKLIFARASKAYRT